MDKVWSNFGKPILKMLQDLFKKLETRHGQALEKPNLHEFFTKMK